MAHTKGVCFCVFKFRSTFSEFSTHRGLWLSLLSVRFIDFNKSLDRTALHSLAPILARWPLAWLQEKKIKNPLWPEKAFSPKTGIIKDSSNCKQGWLRLFLSWLFWSMEVLYHIPPAGKNLVLIINGQETVLVSAQAVVFPLGVTQQITR